MTLEELNRARNNPSDVLLTIAMHAPGMSNVIPLVLTAREFEDKDLRNRALESAGMRLKFDYDSDRGND